MKQNRLVLLVGILSLSACTTYWENPGNSNANFQSDLGVCQNESHRAIPSRQSNDSPTSSSTYCTGGYGSANCNTSYNRGVDTTAVETGINRDGYIDNCLKAKGWREIDQATRNRQMEAMKQEHEKYKNYETIYKAEIDKLSHASQARCNDPEYQIIYTHTPCSSPATLAQLTDKTKITPSQKPVFEKLFNLWNKELAERLRIARQYAHPQSSAMKYIEYRVSVEGEDDSIDLALYEGKITWGEYNVRTRDLGARINAEVKRRVEYSQRQ